MSHMPFSGYWSELAMLRNFACVEATPAEDSAWRAEDASISLVLTVTQCKCWDRIEQWQNIYLDFKGELLSSAGVFTIWWLTFVR